VQACIGRQLRVEARGEQAALAHGDDARRVRGCVRGRREPRDRLHGRAREQAVHVVGAVRDGRRRRRAAAAERLDHRRADEHTGERRVADRRALHVALERVHLRAKAVASHLDVQAAQQLLAAALAAGGGVREHDHARTCAPHGPSLADPCAQRLRQAGVVQAERNGRRLAAGNHERVALRELLGPAHSNAAHRHMARTRAEGCKARDMFVEGALQRQHANRHARPLAHRQPPRRQSAARRPSGCARDDGHGCGRPHDGP